MDTIQSAATARATENAARKSGFIEPGAITPRNEERHFAGGKAEAGSTEAYSAILQSKGVQFSAQDQLLNASKITADSTTKSLAVLTTISAALVDKGAAAKSVPAVGKDL